MSVFPELRFHDLRYTGNTLAAPGASLHDLMARMGQDSPRAALIYQHAGEKAPPTTMAQVHKDIF